MTSKPLNELTIEELKSNIRLLTKAKTISFITLFIVAIVSSFITLKKGISIYTFLPLIFVVLYMGIKGNLTVFNEELSKRFEK